MLSVYRLEHLSRFSYRTDCATVRCAWEYIIMFPLAGMENGVAVRGVAGERNGQQNRFFAGIFLPNRLVMTCHALHTSRV